MGYAGHFDFFVLLLPWHKKSTLYWQNIADYSYRVKAKFLII